MLYLVAGAVAAYALYSFFVPSPRPCRRREDRQHTENVAVSQEAEHSPVETHKAEQEGGSTMLYLIAGAVAAYGLYSLFVDNQDDRPPSPRPSRWRDDRQHTENVEVFQEIEHPPVETHVSLRAKAKQEGNLMAECYRQSKEAYERRDRARAKTLSDQGKYHALRMETLNDQASAIIFNENNQNRPACEVDLHGLYVKEAVAYSEMAVKKARQRGDSEICLIVGQGNHSDGGISKLKPAIQEAMRIRGVHVDVDPKNPGVLRLVI